MGLRTKLVAGTLLFTFVLVVSLSLVFLSEVLRERIAQTQSTNGVLLHAALSSTRTALQQGMVQHPPADNSEAAFEHAVQSTLQSDSDVTDTLNGYVRYSPDIEDASVSGANGTVLVSSNPTLVNRPVPHRRGFADGSSASPGNLRRLLFGTPETLDISLPLDRNGLPFLVVHLGIRSTFLRNAYSPWLRTATMVSLLALGGSLLVAGALSAAALRPIERIGRELDLLSGHSSATAIAAALPRGDAVQRVSSTISRLDAQMRSSEQTRSEMASNLNSMLHALKDGVMVFTSHLKVATASDAVANFLPGNRRALPGTPLLDVFPAGSAIGDLLSSLIPHQHDVHDMPLKLEDGRTIELSLKCSAGAGALVTLHDVAAEEELEHEVQVARRLASIGRLMAGVGHEVKNPINAMVVHLELLRGKLEQPVNLPGAQRHVDVLASEMSRLDRVVQTLADFSRPIEPVLREQELMPIVRSVVQLVSADAGNHHVQITVEEDAPNAHMYILCDAELLRQALLNISLNAMQSMPDGGSLVIRLGRDRQIACLSLSDTGMGIAPDALERIFDLYFTTKAAGSGIGLALTYRIVQLHGGVIQVRSQSTPGSPDRGSTFTLRLPLAKRPAHTVSQVVNA